MNSIIIISFKCFSLINIFDIKYRTESTDSKISSLRDVLQNHKNFEPIENIYSY
jgi:hypothetical protein